MNERLVVAFKEQNEIFFKNVQVKELRHDLQWVTLIMF